jgi:hypothetical protein
MADAEFVPIVMHEIAQAAQTRRREIGLSVAGVAGLANVPVSVVDRLESAADRDLRVLEVASVLSAIGLGLLVTRVRPPSIDRSASQSPFDVAARTASTSFARILPTDALQDALCSGAVPSEFEAHLRTLLDEAPVGLLAKLVEQAHVDSGLSRHHIWVNMHQIAAQLKVRRPFWRADRSRADEPLNPVPDEDLADPPLTSMLEAYDPSRHGGEA